MHEKTPVMRPYTRVTPRYITINPGAHATSDKRPQTARQKAPKWCAKERRCSPKPTPVYLITAQSQSNALHCTPTFKRCKSIMTTKKGDIYTYIPSPSSDKRKHKDGRRHWLSTATQVSERSGRRFRARYAQSKNNKLNL